MVKKDELFTALESQSNQIFQQIGQQIKTLMDQLLPKIPGRELLFAKNFGSQYLGF